MAVFALYARSESEQAFEQLIEREQARLRMAELRLSEVLSEATVDLRVVAAAPAVRGFIAKGGDAREPVAQLFGAFVGEDGSYEELALIDADGREHVRVMRGPEGARPLPQEQLRTRPDPLVTRARKLLARQVEVGRFALDVDHEGRVVVPHKPVLRMAVGVFSGAGQHSDYLVVAKLRGAVLLRGLRELVATDDEEFWLLDEDGYWILHPDPQWTWGAQRDPGRRVASRVPALAKRIGSGPGAVRIDAALYVHRRAAVLANRAGDGLIVRPPTFDLVARTAPARLPPAWPLRLAVPMTIILMLAAGGCAILARLRARSLDTERRERDLLEQAAAANALGSWIKEHLYQLSLKVHAARDLEGFGVATLSELAPTLGLAAACAYALQDGRAQPIAGFALSADFELREFAPGEGLIGEALRSRQDLRLRPPPAGYLDLSAGGGDGAAAEVRILPLWVHGNTVGVLELAFSRPLEAHEEEFLRQALPLLALNLEGLLELRATARPAPA